MEMNKTPLESLCAALAYAMGAKPPKYAEATNEDLTAYIANKYQLTSYNVYED